jgi:hypothetical protein
MMLSGYNSSRWVVCAVPLLRQLVAGFSQPRPWFSPRSVHVEFLVDIVALGQVFSKYLGYLCQLSSHQMLNFFHLSSEAGTKGCLWCVSAKGLSLTPL